MDVRRVLSAAAYSTVAMFAGTDSSAILYRIPQKKSLLPCCTHIIIDWIFLAGHLLRLDHHGTYLFTSKYVRKQHAAGGFYCSLFFFLLLAWMGISIFFSRARAQQLLAEH